MNEMIKILVCMLIGGALGALAYRWYSKAAEIVDTRPVKHVAIVTKNLEMHREIVAGVLSVFAQEQNARIVPRLYYTDAKNRITENSVMERVIEDEPDLVVAIGNALAQCAKGLIAKRAPKIPLIIGAVTDPVGSGLVASLKNTGCNITGAACMPTDNTTSLKLLHTAFPTVKRVLFPYYVESGEAVEQAVHEIAAWGKQHKIYVEPLPIDNDQNGIVLIQSKLGSVDAIMHLQYCVINRIADNIAKLAKQYRVLFYSPNRLFVVNGKAPVGFGLTMEDVGKNTAKVALRVLVNDECPSNIPIDCNEYKQKFFINEKALQEQTETPINPDLLLLLSQVEFVSQAPEEQDASKIII